MTYLIPAISGGTYVTPYPNDVQKIYLVGYFNIPGTSPSSSNVMTQYSWSIYNVLVVVNSTSASLVLQGTQDSLFSASAFFALASANSASNTASAGVITPYTMTPVDGLRLVLPNGTAFPATTSIASMGQIDPTFLRLNNV